MELPWYVYQINSFPFQNLNFASSTLQLVNRQKNNKKKAPIPLTDEMINELNKNHMGGIDNYGAEDFYNLDDWNDRAFETKPKKVREKEKFIIG